MTSKFSDRSIVQLTLVRIREFVREPEALFWVFLFPIVLAAGLGLAFRNRPAEVLKIAATPEMVQSLKREKLLDVQQLDSVAAREALRTGKVALAVEKDAAGAVVFEYDDTNPEGRAARALANQAVQQAAGRRDPVSSGDKPLREPGSRYIDFLLPGLLGMNLMGNSIWGLAFSIVDARKKNLLKRLIATPMPRDEYLLSFLLSRLLSLVVEVILICGFGILVFHVPLRGSLLSFCALCILAAFAFSSMGLVVASRVRTTEAVSGLANAVMMPMWIVSGVFFSSQRFPGLLQPIIQALPLTATIDALRGMMLQGMGLVQLWPQIAVLCAWMIVSFTLALKLFRWR